MVDGDWGLGIGDFFYFKLVCFFAFTSFFDRLFQFLFCLVLFFS